MPADLARVRIAGCNTPRWSKITADSSQRTDLRAVAGARDHVRRPGTELKVQATLPTGLLILA